MIMINSPRVILVLFAVVIYTLFASNLFAQMRTMTTEELVSESEAVVVGTVDEIRSAWTEDRSRIISYVTIDVEEYIKGERAERTITVMQLGGEVDGIGELYSHTARFVKDEEVAVFLKKDRAGHLRVVGGDQGKLTVQVDRGTGSRMIGENQLFEEFKNNLERLLDAGVDR